jgi:5-hydroxyisourate hydrolase-like protein (transthyretin family)
VVVDSDTNKPLEGVEIDIYMKTQKRDSLKKNVITDENGYFLITEKRDTTQLFQLKKAGYLGLVNSLNTKGDTIKLERE